MSAKPIRILLVEDTPADVELIRQGLLQSSVDHILDVVEHGGKALSFLHGEGEFSDAPRPDLMLLDLNLPTVDGVTVLKHVKGCHELRDIPVIVLSSLDEPEVIQQAYQFQAHAYVTKPAGFGELVSLIQEQSDQWYEIVTVAKRDRSLSPRRHSMATSTSKSG